ncbi:pleiotropic regulator 1-like [Haliotis rubra]|uniref:pleiotropic regulator 1-like n=1 Tax=Haliotis rubra TaxID=36100 RepID=UPI001EE572A4|nr:pleiotropic regulator 1-like [Haliotis rubra]
MTEEVQKHSVHTLVFRSLKRTHDMFLSEQGTAPGKEENSEKNWKLCKLRADYGQVKDLPKEGGRKAMNSRDVIRPYGESNYHDSETGVLGTHPYPNGPGVQLTDGTSQHMDPSGAGSREIMLYEQSRQTSVSSGASVHEIRQNAGLSERMDPTSRNISVGQQQMLVPRKAPTMPKPQWHPPWKLYRVISGHLGWVRCIAVEPGNEWFVTGAGDRVIKIWDLATGTLKLSLTGHISAVRGVAVSPRQPYLFSCGEDKQVKCWDLEYNKAIRHYHGHLSAVHSLDIHPTIDILCSCGRDGTVRVWDMRTKACVHTMVGHQNTVAVVKCQAAEPQVVTGSHDCTVRLWDLAAGRTKVTLTNHKKSVRGLALHPTQYTFASASPDNIKQWKFPDGNFIQNLSGHNAIVNSLAVNSDNILVSAADNGTMHFWDWRTGYNFQRLQAAVQPGSIDSEAGIFAVQFDHSGTRLITAEADKTIKIYKEDDTATEESHPINWRPDILKKKRY